MSAIKKLLIWTSNASALWTFLLLYVTVLGHSKTAGTTLFGSQITPLYGFSLAGIVLVFIALSYLLSKIKTPFTKPLDGFWGLLVPFIWTAISCSAGLYIMYEVSLLVEP